MMPRKTLPLLGPTGMTLIEMLVATAATLMLMGALAQIFSVFGSAVTNSRSMIEQDARLRSVAWLLRTDLANATARMLPPLDPATGEGYLEIIEGSRRDGYDATGSRLLAGDLVGDVDDILLLTTRSSEAAFIGKAGSALVESPTAEVAWFLRQTSPPTTPITYTLYRRQLLVVGYAGFGPFVTNNESAFSNWSSQWMAFYNDYDISARLEGTTLIPNTLSDLTRRESRFMHKPIPNSGTFPYEFQSGVPGLFFDAAAGSTRGGEDVVLTNIIAFDVRVFDPAAPISIPSSGDAAAVPGDVGFSATSTTATGCYVDLANNTPSITSNFSDPPQRNYLNPTGTFVTPTWDTWSTHYESNGLDEDSTVDAGAGVDQGSNGLDDAVGIWPQNGLVDEPQEQETSPPYPFPLRGLEIRIRVYEPSSRQVRQATVRHTFVPH